MILGVDTVTRLRGTASMDEYGNSSLDFGTPGRSDITGCSVQPVSGSEFNEGRDAIVTRWTLFLPLSGDLTGYDRIEWRGVSYLVDGSVGEWDDPFNGVLSHKVCLLKLVEG